MRCGDLGSVLRRHLRNRRAVLGRQRLEQPAKPTIPKVRDLIALMTIRPDKRTAEGTVLLNELCARCPDLELPCAWVWRFAVLLLTRSGAERLAQWIDHAQEMSAGPHVMIVKRGSRSPRQDHGQTAVDAFRSRSRADREPPCRRIRELCRARNQRFELP
jgi:hypothetical protein